MNSIYKNTAYAYLLQLSGMIFPLITAPIVSKALGAEMLGLVGYAGAIAAWASLLGAFGTASYGLREVAKVRGDPAATTHLFSELMMVKGVFSFLAILVYAGIAIWAGKTLIMRSILMVQGLQVALNLFSMDWFFQGLEDYRYITVRTLVVRVVSIILIVIFVNNKSDVLLYAGISVIALSLNNVSNFMYAARRVGFRMRASGARMHLKPLTVFFTSALVVSVYGLLDQVFLGAVNDPKGLAFYSRSRMLLGLGMSLGYTVVNVITARVSNYYENEKEKYHDLLGKSLSALFLVTVPITTGLFLLSREIMIFLGGQEFAAADLGLRILSPLVVVVPLGMWNYSQRLLPESKERAGLACQMVMAVQSLVCNAFLIPRLGAVGAAISYLMAEITGSALGFVVMRKARAVRVSFLSLAKVLVATALMGVTVVLGKSVWDGSMRVMLTIPLGCIVYFFALLALDEKTVKALLASARGIIRRRERA